MSNDELQPREEEEDEKKPSCVHAPCDMDRDSGRPRDYSPISGRYFSKQKNTPHWQARSGG